MINMYQGIFVSEVLIVSVFIKTSHHELSTVKMRNISPELTQLFNIPKTKVYIGFLLSNECYLK